MRSSRRERATWRLRTPGRAHLPEREFLPAPEALERVAPDAEAGRCRGHRDGVAGVRSRCIRIRARAGLARPPSGRHQRRPRRGPGPHRPRAIKFSPAREDYVLQQARLYLLNGDAKKSRAPGSGRCWRAAARRKSRPQREELMGPRGEARDGRQRERTSTADATCSGGGRARPRAPGHRHQATRLTSFPTSEWVGADETTGPRARLGAHRVRHATEIVAQRDGRTGQAS